MTRQESVRWRILVVVGLVVLLAPLAWVSAHRVRWFATILGVAVAVDIVAGRWLTRNMSQRRVPRLSALDAAVRAGDYERARELIARAAKVDEWDELGMTVLLYAVYRGDLEGTRFLLENGADPNKESRQGTTPLWHAADDFGLDNIAAVLREHGAQA